MPTPRLLRRAILERASRPLLARFLHAHAADFCSAHGLSLDAFLAADPRDRSFVHRLFAALHAARPVVPLSDGARRAFGRFDALATAAAGDALILRSCPVGLRQVGAGA